MINANNDIIFNTYTESINNDPNELKSFIYSKDQTMEYSKKKEFKENDIKNLTLCDDKISKIITLGIKKGWICSRGCIINVGKENDFRNFLTIIKGKFEAQWKSQFENVIKKDGFNFFNAFFNYWMEKCYKKEWRAYYCWIKEGKLNSEIEFENLLIEHMKFMDPDLLDVYNDFLTATLILCDSLPKKPNTNILRANKLSKIVRDYLSKNSEKRKMFIKLFILKMIVEKNGYCNKQNVISMMKSMDEDSEKNEYCNKQNLEGIIKKMIKKNSLCVDDNVMEELDKKCLNNEEYKAYFIDTIPKLRCFIHNDFCEIENEIESIKKMLISFLTNSDEINSLDDDEIKNQIKLWKLLYDYENYECIDTIICEDNNIEKLRTTYSDGLHFVVGDLHGSLATLNKLLTKIKYDKEKDHIYFVGDYYSTKDGDVDKLINRLNEDFHTDYSKPGFHLIKGNHDENDLSGLPNVIVLKMKNHTFYISHASVYNKVIDIIYTDMKTKPEKSIFTYKFDTNAINSKSNGEAKKCYRMIWSKTGNFNPQKNSEFIQDTINSKDEKACIIHGHTPYCYLKIDHNEKKYGSKPVFWKKQHIWFSEDMRSFDIDSNVKGYLNGHENEERRLSCICLEAYDELPKLTIKNIYRGENGVFSVKHECDNKSSDESSQISDLLKKIKEIDCKIITVDDKGQLIIREKDDNIN